MTRHNLDTHISWLLSFEADSPAFVHTNTEEISASGSRILGGRHREEDPTRQFRIATPSPANGFRIDQTTNAAEGSARRLIPPPPKPQSQFVAGPLEDESMGKLTSTSRSSRPALISQRQPPTPASTGNSTGTAASLMQNYTNLLRDNAATPNSRTPRDMPASKFQRTLQTPQTPRQTPRPKTEHKHEKIESVDLTGDDYSDALPSRSSSTEIGFGEPKVIWHEDAALRAEPLPPRTSKKRKSGEMTPGRSKRKNSHQSLTKSTKARNNSMEGFVDIDDVASRRAQLPRKQFTTPSSGRIQPSVEERSEVNLFKEALQITETFSTVETHTRTSISRGPSVAEIDTSRRVSKDSADEPSHSDLLDSNSQLFVQVAASPASRQIASPDPGSILTPERRQKQRLQKVIQDSDEDGDEVLCSVEKRASCSPRVSVKTNLSVIDSTKSSKWYDIPAFNTASAHKIKDSSRSRTGSPLRPMSQNLPVKTGMLSSLSQLDTQVKALVPSGSQKLSSSQQTPAASLGTEEKRLVTFYLKQPSAIKVYLDRIENSIDANGQAVLECLDEERPRFAQLKEERKLLLTMKQAYSELEKYRAEHAKLLTEKKSLARQICQMLDLNTDTSQPEERQSALTIELRQVENNIGQLLHTSGAIKDGFGTGVDFESPDTRSTNPLKAHEIPPRNSNTSTIGSAQVILQTQFPSLPQKLTANSGAHILDDLPDRSPRREQSAYSIRQQLSPSPVRRAATTMPPIEPRRDPYEDWNKLSSQTDQPNFSQTPVAREYGSEVGDDALAELLLQEAQEIDDMYADEVMPVPEDYGDSGDDDEILEFAQEVERRTSHPPIVQQKSTRQALSETSHNTSVTRGRSTTRKDMYSHVDADHSKLLKFPWSNDIKKCLKDRFKLKGFRQNQLEAINATLGGEDAFVLMPTGGGKSLCYQLPAIVQSGKTKGVTIVISPLLSLMNDQVNSLRSKDIQAYTWNGETDAEEKATIRNCLRETYPEQWIQLLYITPEMIIKSGQMKDLLSGLHKKKKLARIVIDEAHCVSQWGHDFRPEYVALGKTRGDFPGVPLMALTATATENVKADVMHNLSMGKCPVFSQSFNRPNLIYEVRPKKGRKQADMVEEIANMINSKYRGQTGIIYTLSRKGCEDLAANLQEKHGIRAYHYHASLPAEEKNTIQRDWQSGRLQVVVATIAFGMGIDKPDVRFVIHFMVPKSLEGYYQETGRAGRDGKRSGCYLYYGYSDTAMLKKFIYESEASDEQKDRQRVMLSSMIGYCENRADCRRMQVLAYFGERFSKEECNHTCDNCSSDAIFEMEDFTTLSKAALEIVKQVRSKKATLLNCVDLLRGANTKNLEKLDPQNITGFGLGKSVNRGDLERLFYRLLMENALAEYSVVNKGGFPTQYLELGPNCSDFRTGRRKIHLQIQKTSPRPATKKKKAIKESSLPASTMFTSPIAAASRRRQHHPIVVEEDEGDYRSTQDSFIVPNDKQINEDEYFESTHDSRSRGKERSRAGFGTPITTDQRMKPLPDVHRDVVHAFVQEAKNIEEKIRNRTGARKAFFTEANFQDMAILWTVSMESMRQIPQIDIDRVNQYGKHFLPLIGEFYKRYNDMMSEQESHGDVDMDDNHRNVIDLVSDDEEGMEEDEEEYGGFGDYDDNDDDLDNVAEQAPETKFSRYFPNTGSKSSTKSSISSHPFPAATTNRSASGSSKPTRSRSTYRYTKGKGRSTKRAGSRKSSGSTSAQSNGGVLKRGGKSRGGRGGDSVKLIRKYANQEGGSMGGGIGMMPT